MHWIWAIVMTIMIVTIIKRGTKINNLKAEILKLKAEIKTLSDENHDYFIRLDSTTSQTQDVAEAPRKPKNKPQKHSVSYSKALELKERKITSKYLYPKKIVEDTDNYFYRKKVVITGVYSDYPDRNELAEIIWDMGADIDVGIGKNTEILIAGNEAGPVKIKKAEAQNIEIIYQDELEDYLI